MSLFLAQIAVTCREVSFIFNSAVAIFISLLEFSECEASEYLLLAVLIVGTLAIPAMGI